MEKTHSFWYRYRYFIYLVPMILIGIFPDRIERFLTVQIEGFNLNKNSHFEELFVLREAIYINIFGTLFFIATTSTRFFDSIIKEFSPTNHKSNQIILFKSFSVISIGFVIALAIGIYTKLNYPAHKDILMFLQNEGGDITDYFTAKDGKIYIYPFDKNSDKIEEDVSEVTEQRIQTFIFLTGAMNFITIFTIFLIVILILILFIFEPLVQIFVTGYKDLFIKKLPE